MLHSNKSAGRLGINSTRDTQSVSRESESFVWFDLHHISVQSIMAAATSDRAITMTLVQN